MSDLGKAGIGDQRSMPAVTVARATVERDPSPKEREEQYLIILAVGLYEKSGMTAPGITEWFHDWFPRVVTGNFSSSKRNFSSSKRLRDNQARAIRNYFIWRACLSLKESEEVKDLEATAFADFCGEHIKRFENDGWEKYQDGNKKPKSEFRKLLIEAHRYHKVRKGEEGLPCGRTKIMEIIENSLYPTIQRNHKTSE